ncbi:MAG TPA: NADH-quinone oxidoreductase subunit M, partial [Puia sp.]|nr:NADH-quinone oxidoreductase subunit M [Puia sp.]
NVVFTVTAATTVFLAAIYMLRMVQGVFYGPANALTEKAIDIRMNEKIILGFIVAVIILIGVYPEPLFHLTRGAVESVLAKMYVKP